MSPFEKCLLCAASVFFTIHWLPYLVSPQHESTRHWRSPRMRALLLFGQFKIGTLIEGIIAFVISSHRKFVQRGIARSRGYAYICVMNGSRARLERPSHAHEFCRR